MCIYKCVYVVSKFEIIGEGYRSVDVLTNPVGSLQVGAPAIHNQLLAAVWDYPLSELFNGIGLTYYGVHQWN